MHPLRLTLTLPGAASLGAFQAGAISAVSVMIRTLRERGRDVHVDAVGGASAGSIVGMLACHCLLTGRDTTAMLRSAWVDEVDIALLRSGGSHAPLAFDDLAQRIRSFLDDDDRFPRDVHPALDTPIVFHVGLTSLLGFTEPLDAAGGQDVSLTFVDWLAYDLTPLAGNDEITEPVGSSLLDAALVSASHPGAFAPRTIDRSRHGRLDADAPRPHDRRTITNVAADGRLWYTDGGLVEARPIGRVLAAARRRADAESGRDRPEGRRTDRLHIVVDPRSSGPSGDERWADPDGERTWIDGVRRALSVLPTQALHDDLRTVADVNRRLDHLDRLTDELADELDARDGNGPVDRRELRARLADIGGLAGKERVDVEMISPLVRAAGDDGVGVSDLLAGDFIGAFGGFVDRSIRASDFLLGWQSARSWMPDALARHDVGPADVDAVAEAVDDARGDDWRDSIMTGDAVDRLDLGHRWQIALLAAQVARVLVSEAVPTRMRHPLRRSAT